jgi:hypothetical protein
MKKFNLKKSTKVSEYTTRDLIWSFVRAPAGDLVSRSIIDLIKNSVWNSFLGEIQNRTMRLIRHSIDNDLQNKFKK